MSSPVALFVGEGSWDNTQRIPRLPEVDEKVNSTEFVESFGGVAANASVACARTGAASRALLRLGRDAVSDLIIDRLSDAGVCVVADKGEGITTRATILLEPHGEKRLLLFGGAGLYPSAAAVAAVDLSDIRWVHTTLYSPESTAILLTRCREHGIPVSIDLEPGSFQDLDTIADHLRGAAVVFANSRTHERLGDAVTALLALGVKAVIRTRGPDGASWHNGQTHHAVAISPSPLVDTTGAGDCLAGWFIGESLNGRPAAEALARAVHAATLSCSSLGSSSAYPACEDVEKSIQKGLL
jgi:ribokinase